MVSLDNAQQGITPITLYHVPVGTHTVTVHEKGWVDNITRIRVDEGQTADLTISLVRPGTSPTTLQTAATTVPVTAMAGDQKAAASSPPPVSTSAMTGSIQVICNTCNTDMVVRLFPVMSAPNEPIVYGTQVAWSYYTDGMVINNLPPGRYNLHVGRSDCRNTGRQDVTVVAGQQAVVTESYVCSPGFEGILVVIGLAGIIGFRRFPL
jgi:hypothetical protein